MHALISGRSRRALIIDGELLKSFDFDNPSKIVPRRKSDLSYLFGEAADLRILENTTMALVESELEDDCNFTCALDLSLISLDSELPDDIREEALEGLGELLRDLQTRERLANVLYAEPFPKDTDLAGALKLCKTRATTEAKVFLMELNSLQPLIRAVKQAWEVIPTKSFGSYEKRGVFRQSAIRAGIFRALVWSPEKPELKLRVLKHTLPQSIESFPNYEGILEIWTENLRSVKPVVKDRSERRQAGDRRESILAAKRTEKKSPGDRKKKRLAG